MISGEEIGTEGRPLNAAWPGRVGRSGAAASLAGRETNMPALQDYLNSSVHEGILMRKPHFERASER